MKIYETAQNEFVISTDKKKLDVEIIHNYLCNESYWAKNIPIEMVKKSIDGSCCFGLYVNQNSISKQTLHAGSPNSVSRQIGFARVISDFATFGYLADVFILDAYRARGLSKWMMETIMNYPDLQGLRRWLLATKDAHGLYTKFGFSALDKPERIMGFKPFEEYPPVNL